MTWFGFVAVEAHLLVVTWCQYDINQSSDVLILILYIILYIILYTFYPIFSTALASLLAEGFHLTINDIDVFLASSKTPLPISSDCYRLAHSVLYVRGNVPSWLLYSELIYEYSKPNTVNDTILLHPVEIVRLVRCRLTHSALNEQGNVYVLRMAYNILTYLLWWGKIINLSCSVV